MKIDMVIVVLVTAATAAAGLWLTCAPRSYLQFAARFPRSRISPDAAKSRSRQLLTRVTGCLVLGLAAALVALVVHVLTT